MLRLATCFAALCLIGCGQPADDGIPDRYRFLQVDVSEQGSLGESLAGLPYEKLELEELTTVNWNSTTITLWSDGRAEQDGKRGKFSPYEFGRLCFLLERLEFEALDPEYDHPASPHLFTTVRAWPAVDRDPIEVREVSMVGPPRLWTIHRALEGVASRVTWEDTSALLLANGFESPVEVRAFVTSLRAAAEAGDLAALAEAVHYPLTLYEGGTPLRTFASANEVLADFDSAFDESVLKALKGASFNALFVRDQGAMIGDGEVWLFQYAGGVRIKALNPTREPGSPGSGPR